MFTFTELLALSQADHVTRARMPRDGVAFIGSELGAWGSRHAAIRTALCLMQEVPNQLPITLECPECERF